VGDGYGSVAVVGNRVFVTGNEGLDDEFVQALDVAIGRPLWRRRLGKVGNPDQAPNYSASKSTPTVDGQFLYALGSDGDLACLSLANGEIRWQKNLRATFGGTPGMWGYSESPLVDGNVLVCSPGGSVATIVALNKASGDAIWKSAMEEGYPAGYASPIAATAAGRKQYIQYLAMGMVGVDAATGRFLWRSHETERDTANWTTAIVRENMVYASASGIGSAVELTPKDDGGLEPKNVYRLRGLPSWIGGAVLIDGYLYGTTEEILVCADFKTGEVKWKNASIGVGSVCSADGLLFIHGENGDVALVEITPADYHERGRF
jgi:outer membrane protein assembly factor BamB